MAYTPSSGEEQPGQMMPPPPPPSGPPSSPVPAGSTGLAPNVASFLCYLFTWVTGLIFLLIEKNNKVVRFHAIQAIGLGVAWTVLWIITIPLGVVPVLGIFFRIFAYLILALGMFILWIVMMVTAYQGKMIRLPIIGDIAAKSAGI
jgi:uncharacterized membrane protein